MRILVKRHFQKRFSGTHRALGLALLGVLTAVVASAQGEAAAKTAEQAYKNIQSFKGTPADQLLPAMQFMSSSLGVECSFCHVEGKMEADDKREKKTARAMIAMTANINKESFGGHREVTCYSCHHGAEHPSSVPPVLETDASGRAQPKPAASTPAPSAEEIVNKYIAAVGGVEAMGKLNTRVQTGVILVAGRETPIEVITKAPNKRMSISHGPNGDSITAYDGARGWLGNTGRPAREMSAPESDAAGLDAQFFLAPVLKTTFKELRRGRPEKVGDVTCNVLVGTRPGQPPVRLYFDADTGLLVRMVRYGETPVGRNPTQIDYADYKEVDGVKIPLRWTLARTTGRFTIQIKDVKQNVAVEDARFSKPDGPVK